MYISHMVLCYSFFYLYRNIDFPAAEMQHNLLSQSTTFVDPHFHFFVIINYVMKIFLLQTLFMYSDYFTTSRHVHTV